jgi:hypothetical protein
MRRPKSGGARTRATGISFPAYALSPLLAFFAEGFGFRGTRSCGRRTARPLLETGGSPVTPPTRQSFGTHVMENDGATFRRWMQLEQAEGAAERYIDGP